MHEVDIMNNILDLAEVACNQQGASRIHQITLRIGRLAGIEGDSLGLAFEIARIGTPAEEAILKIEEVPIICWCQRCEKEFRSEDFIFACPRCEHISTDVRQGREMELSSMEVS
jgi:hydrogenase nickel incorporation protein HypA/HybF